MRTLQGSTLLLLLLLLAAGCVHAYKPVIIVHGLFDGPKEFTNLTGFITKVHPETEVMTISQYDYKASVTTMWQQVKAFRNDIEKIMLKYPDGVHLLCFSQGGLICRGVLSTMPHHNVHTFIALSSPLAGQYGETSYLKRIFPDSVKKEVHVICYNKVGQIMSICNYWNDPHYRSSYLRKNNFLPVLNGENPPSKMSAWRENFLRIKKLVLIGGPDDGVITPWQSRLLVTKSLKNLMTMVDPEEGLGNKSFASYQGLQWAFQPFLQHSSTSTWYLNMGSFSIREIGQCTKGVEEKRKIAIVSFLNTLGWLYVIDQSA
ncbi:lysosomal thioesterase PPT2-A-like isoform X1 [Melanotaenia boesemani]|uniref:lysosomal thioesterase PPT2-A-like isoform X1 n=1 Tax=Melanotaenia boesemani TaxID=1250792 RepID=UPI001C05720F|nr:lysosomal thioesterase PPT2-A-like isoform X1 [Melanotaenia boesemani]